MKKFILKVLGYLIVVAVATMVFLYSTSDHYWDYHVPVVKKRLLHDIDKKENISIILGSSEAMHGINSKEIDSNCYNLASVSQSYYEDYYILKYIQSRAKKIKSVYLPLGYFSNHLFLFETQTPGEALRAFDYEKAYDIKYPLSVGYFVKKGKLYMRIAKSLLSPNSISDFDDRGNLLRPCTGKDNDISDAQASFERHGINANFKIVNPYFDSIVTICKQHDIALYVLVLPVTKSYRTLTDASDFKAFKAKIKNDADGKYTFLDYSDNIQDNETVLFKDADHLSPCGEEIFSKNLKQELHRLSSSDSIH